MSERISAYMEEVKHSRTIKEALDEYEMAYTLIYSASGRSFEVELDGGNRIMLTLKSRPQNLELIIQQFGNTAVHRKDVARHMATAVLRQFVGLLATPPALDPEPGA